MEKRLLLKDAKGELIAELLSFTYNAKRMGGAPTISATLHSFNEIYLTTDDYVEFNGERYYIKQTPTSSKSNTDARYKYDLEFVSERIMLDNIYLHDASWSNSDASKAIAKSSNFPFSGSVRDLADKINASLAFSNVSGYYIEVGDDILSEESKFIQFSDVFISNAIQEFYNTFEIPYYFYWNGNKTVVRVTYGSAQHPNESFEYGKDNALLSITKTNANYKIINKCTGVGSSENIPYYYPNLSSTGEHTFESDEDFGVVSINYDILDKHTNLRDGATLTYHKKPSEVSYNYRVVYRKWERKSASVTSEDLIQINGSTSIKDTSSAKLQTDGYFKAKRVTIEFTAKANDKVSFEFQCGVQTIDGTDGVVDGESVKLLYEIKEGDALSYVGKTIVASTALDNGVFYFTAAKDGTYSASVYIYFKVNGGSQKNELPINISATFTPYRKVYKEDYLTFDDSDKEIGLSLSGVRVAKPKDGGKIVVSETLNWLEPQVTLMPSIYRGTNGLERYYIASNEDVVVDGYQYGFNGHEFTNPFVYGRPKEHILKVEDLKPTIKGMSIGEGDSAHRIDKFIAFEYDKKDNDEIDDNNNYKHSFFYAKLSKLDFNLFEHASEQGDMTISFTSGECAACNFTVMVDSDSKKNTVQVDDKGNLLRDEEGNVKIGIPQSRQQDTINNEVWIALKKEDSTMGVVMPNVKEDIKPSPNDTFVITNINLPNSYIKYAEKLLEDKIKEYLISNNDDKFNFSIKFSRIYLAEHGDVIDQITENASLNVIYQGKEAILYVSSYTYKMTAGESLPEITVALSDTLSTQRGVMQNVINQVKMDVMTSVANVDIVAQGARAFIRKDQNDQTVHRLSVNELNVTTNSNIGGDLDVENNASVSGELTVDRKTTIKDSLNVGADITVGDYKEILGEVDGAKIAQDGSAVFKSIRANSLEIFTLIYNQIRSTSAFTSFDDTATIIGVEHINGDLYKITFEQDNSYESQPFAIGDIIFGYVNAINNYGYSKYGRCWLRVSELIDDDVWSINAIMFPVDECPDGTNIPPTTNMVVTHRGNVLPENKDRQRTFFISSKDGYIVQLLGVTSPKLYTLGSEDNPNNYSNYGVVIGRLPDDLFNYILQKHPRVESMREQPIMYARALAVQDLLLLDYAGQPVKTANYRGHWSVEIAKGLVEGESKYLVTDNIYDTVTHKGALWACRVSETTVEPSDNAGEWVKQVYVEESESAKYDIIPSVNIIYYRTATDTLSTNSVDVKIGVQTFHGNYEITRQSLLDEKGLGVYYAIDGVFENAVKLNISTVALLQLEDGSAILATESGNGLSLEGDDIDVASIKDNITLYLIDEATGEELAKYIIPVTKDGQQGDKGADGAGYSVYVDTPIISHPIDPKTKATIGSGTYQVEVQVLNNGTPLATENILPIYALHGSGVTVDWTQNEKSYTFIISIPADLSDEQRTKRVELYFYGKAGYEFPSGDIRGNIAIAYLERGMVGNDGPLPYRCGVWTEEAAKSGAYPPASDIAPYVVYPANSKNRYVRTSNPYPVDANGNNIYIAPDIDWGTSTATTRCWRLMPHYEELFVDMLFADFAHMAKAVFFGDYMFSEEGVDRNGSKGVYDAYVDDKFGNEPMFNAKRKLSGSFIPNLFMNLRTGETKSNCFSEPFAKIEYKQDDNSYIYQINPSLSHNVSIEYGRINATTNDYEPIVIFMPKSDNITDGANCTIVYQSVAMQGGVKEIGNKEEWGETLAGKLAIICADGRIPTMTKGYDNYTDEVSEGLFMINGLPTRFLLIGGGDVVKMKSVNIKGDKRVWVVENQSDFSAVKASYEILTDGDDFTITSSYTGNYPQSTTPMTFASKQIFINAPKDSDGEFDSKQEGLGYQISLREGDKFVQVFDYTEE